MAAFHPLRTLTSNAIVPLLRMESPVKLSCALTAVLITGAMLVAEPAPAAPSLASVQPVSIGSSLHLQSATLSENRRIFVHLPPGYESGGKRFPVLYVLDAEFHFPLVSSLTDYLASGGAMPQVIVVGIVNTNRTRDLTPAAATTKQHVEIPALATSVDLDWSGGGGADRFAEFLKSELIPAVEAAYRTAPFRILAGHSHGGLFASHVLTTEPTLFNAYLAASPSLWWDNNALIRRAARQMPNMGPRQTWLFAASGEENGQQVGALDDLKAMLQISAPKGLVWTTELLAGETHPTTPHKAYSNGLQWLFKSFVLPDVMLRTGDTVRVERHYAAASRLYGYDLKPAEAVFLRMAYNLLQMKSPERAVSVFQTNAKRHPQSANAHDSLADGLEAAGRDREALASREVAVRLATEQGDPHADAFRSGLVRLRKKLAVTR